MNERTKPCPERAARASDPLDLVMRYHQETKHHFSRYARSLGYLDWANQPDPFRRYEGTSLFALPRLKPEDTPASPLYEDLYRAGAIESAPVSVRCLSRLFEYSLAISAPDIAVGTPIARRPPHRTERAQFRHSAPTSGD